MARKILRKVPYLLVVSILLLTGCGEAGSNEIDSATPYPTPVQTTYTVKTGDIKIETELLGRVQALALQTAYFQMSGHVSAVYTQANDTVVEGQLLGELVELQQLKAEAIAAGNQIRRAAIQLESARLTLEKLRAEGKPSYDIKIQELQVELALMDYNEVLIGLGIDPDADFQGDVESQISKARVYAPTSGVIISAVGPGRAVSPTTPAFVIGDGSQLEIVADLDASRWQEQVSLMFEGMPVLVSPTDAPGTVWTGTIRQLPSPYGTGSEDDRSVHVVLDPQPPVEEYAPGGTVSVRIELVNKPGVLWLPPEAVRQVSGRTFVIENTESGPKRIDILVGLATRDMVEIVSGLVEGQVVVGP
jgi:multidrug efflux pump subunit AcrA (membrane-fusion protein)